MTGPIVIVGADAPQPPDWAYQAPRTPQDHPNQHYYRPSGIWEPAAKVFRFSGDTGAQLTVRVPGAQVQMDLDPRSLTRLRDAINDALVDIQVDAADAERQASLDRISEELREAGDNGTGCYYAHPDVHYVPADQCAAKAAALTAAGVQRFMVLPDPAEVPA